MSVDIPILAYTGHIEAVVLLSVYLFGLTTGLAVWLFYLYLSNRIRARRFEILELDDEEQKQLDDIAERELKRNENENAR